MKRAGFTMIELIFVIVILGILSAVALPKFIGVSEQAEAGKCKSFVGTLNRTVLPALWSDQVLNGTDNDDAYTGALLLSQITPPTECGDSGVVATIAAQYAKVAEDGTGFQVTVGDTTYDVNGTLATTNVAPIIEWNKAAE